MSEVRPGLIAGLELLRNPRHACDAALPVVRTATGPRHPGPDAALPVVRTATGPRHPGPKDGEDCHTNARDILWLAGWRPKPWQPPKPIGPRGRKDL